MFAWYIRALCQIQWHCLHWFSFCLKISIVRLLSSHVTCFSWSLRISQKLFHLSACCPHMLSASYNLLLLYTLSNRFLSHAPVVLPLSPSVSKSHESVLRMLTVIQLWNAWSNDDARTTVICICIQIDWLALDLLVFSVHLVTSPQDILNTIHVHVR